ncbi:SDR family oxidoreductase [Streptomyces sp. NPDC002911]
MTGVLVTGGTGKTGSVLAELLRGNGMQVRVASRNSLDGDPDAVRFDWADPATHATALSGMDRVYLVPPTNTTDPMPLVKPFLAEAGRLGVRNGWVVLRASGFMQNLLGPHPLGERIRRHREIHTAAGAGRLGWIDARDIAAAARALLIDPGVQPGDQRDYLSPPWGTASKPAGKIWSALSLRQLEAAGQSAGVVGVCPFPCGRPGRRTACPCLRRPQLTEPA